MGVSGGGAWFDTGTGRNEWTSLEGTGRRGHANRSVGAYK